MILLQLLAFIQSDSCKQRNFCSFDTTGQTAIFIKLRWLNSRKILALSFKFCLNKYLSFKPPILWVLLCKLELLVLVKWVII